MSKQLSEMSLEELWQLFQILLTEHQDFWKEWYFEEESLLKNVLPRLGIISHIGSTAIPAIWAKPIIDILVQIPKESNLFDYKDLIIKNGYICMSQSEDGISFNKGYTENGFAERVFHLVLTAGCTEVNISTELCCQSCTIQTNLLLLWHAQDVASIVQKVNIVEAESILTKMLQPEQCMTYVKTIIFNPL